MEYRIDSFGLVINREPGELPNQAEVEQAKGWISSKCRRLDKGFYQLNSSQGLRNRMNADLKSAVSNGAFIQAALDLGYKIKPAGQSDADRNALFNFSPIRVYTSKKQIRFSYGLKNGR